MTNALNASPEYAQFRQTFFEECAELLVTMEDRVQALSTGGLDQEELNAVFRSVHSIKAGAGAFNYSELVSFSHSFEALLDRLRDGRMPINDMIANLIVKSADILAELVSAAREDRSLEAGFGPWLRQN